MITRASTTTAKSATVASPATLKTQKEHLNTIFESKFGPLLSFKSGNFEVYPLDGDYFNDIPSNFLLSGPNHRVGITDRLAQKGEILRLIFDDNEQVYSYIYQQKGEFFEIRGRNVAEIRRKIHSDTSVPPLRNEKFLLTPAEYMSLVADVEAGLVDLDGRNLHFEVYKKTHF